MLRRAVSAAGRGLGCSGHGRSRWISVTAAPRDGSATEADAKNDGEAGSAEQPDAVDDIDYAALLAEKEEAIAKFQRELEESRLLHLAEKQNIYKSKQKEVDQARELGISKFAKDLLGVADSVDLAIKYAPMDVINQEVAPGEAAPPAKVMYDGVLLIQKELMKTFGKHGIEVVSPEIGTELDPNSMMAAFELPQDGLEPGSVSVVQQVGYTLKSRVLREATVGVVPK